MDRLGFFKVFLLELFSKTMNLPLAFTKCIQDQLPERAILTDKHDNLWQVKVGKTSDNMYFFHDGWSTFIKDNSVKDYDSLLFEYFGKGFFSVKLFDSFGLEKKLESETSIFKGIERKEDKVKEGERKEKEDRPKEAIGEEFIKVEEADEEEDENEQMKEEHKEEVNGDAVEMEGDDDDDEEQIEAVNEGAEEEDVRHGRYEVPRGSDGEEENSGMNDCARRRSKCVQVKQGTSAANEVQCSRKRARSDLDEVVIGETTQGRKRVTMSYGEHLFDSGLAVKPNNPFFMSRITSQRKHELYVPLSFIKTGGVNLEEVTYLVDSQGKKFDLKYTPWSGGRVVYTGAWKRFCQKNLVKEGDVCICEFVQGSDGLYIKVTVVTFCDEDSPFASVN